MKWKRALSILPLAFFFSMLSLAGEPEPVPVVEFLKGNMFGTYSYGDAMIFVMTMERLWFLVLFPLLYGMYIAGEFQRASCYVFSRIRDRRGWFVKKAAGLFVCDAVYSGGYLAVICLLSTLRSTLPFDLEALKMAGWLFVFVFLWNLQTALLVNLLAIKWNILAGFFVGYGCLAVMVVLAVNEKLVWLNQYVNPILITGLDQNMSNAGLQKLVINLIYSAVLFAVCMRAVKKYDILYIEQE